MNKQRSQTYNDDPILKLLYHEREQNKLQMLKHNRVRHLAPIVRKMHTDTNNQPFKQFHLKRVKQYRTIDTNTELYAKKITFTTLDSWAVDDQ